MKKAIVTGATGFIGKFLVRELVKQNVEVIAVVRRGTKNLNTINALPVKIVECNIADYHMLPDMIADRDIDVVFHIAWQGVSDLDARNEAIQMQNLQSTLDLIDAMHIMRIGCFIGCGSMHEAESLVEMNEDKVISNLGYMYKATKTAAHWIGKAKCGTYGIRFFWPLINTYGEEERSARLVNTIIRKVLHGESPDLSAGNQYYDFVHVSDVARALILIAEKGVDGTNYTIGSGDAKPLKEFLKIVGQVANDLHDGEPVELGFGKITSNVISLPITTFDVTKLYKDTGFKPFPYILVRNFLCVGIPYFCIGNLIREKRCSEKWNRKILQVLIVVFTITSLAERFVLVSAGLNATRDHYLSTTFLAICLFVYTLKSNWHNKGLAVIGRKCSTWLYIIHPIFITAFSVATGKLGIKSIYRCVAPIVTYCATLTFLIVMCRLKSLLVKNNQRK